MSGIIDKKLAELGITIAAGPAPAANYVPYVQSGNLVYVSGQLPKSGDDLMVGKVGDDFTVEQATEAARICAINLIAQVKEACGGDLDRVKRVVKLGGFVNATPDFTQHPAVINGASNLMGDVFGDKGAHARAAVGCGSLPLGVPVEIEGIFEIE